MTIVASSTNTSSALNVMHRVVFSPLNGDRPDVNNVGIVITDGQSDDRQVRCARDETVIVIIIIIIIIIIIYSSI